MHTIRVVFLPRLSAIGSTIILHTGMPFTDLLVCILCEVMAVSISDGFVVS